MRKAISWWFVLAIVVLGVASGFYLPTLGPAKFCTKDDEINYNIPCQVFDTTRLYMIAMSIFVHYVLVALAVHVCSCNVRAKGGAYQ